MTAMIEAEKLDIPVILGDAPQNDTLRNIKSIVSVDIFNPKKIIEGTLFLVSVGQLSIYCLPVHEYCILVTPS